MSTDRTSLQTLDGDVQVLCTFDYSRAERQTYLEPGCAASVCITGVSINGHDVDASVFHPKVIATWEADILREVLDDAESDRAYADEARAEMARDDAMVHA